MLVTHFHDSAQKSWSYLGTANEWTLIFKVNTTKYFFPYLLVLLKQYWVLYFVCCSGARSACRSLRFLSHPSSDLNISCCQPFCCLTVFCFADLGEMFSIRGYKTALFINPLPWQKLAVNSYCLHYPYVDHDSVLAITALGKRRAPVSTTCLLVPVGIWVKHSDPHTLMQRLPKVASASPTTESPDTGSAPSLYMS